MTPSPAATAAPALASLRGTPGLAVRPAAERFHSRHDWLDSRHSFRFAGHDDPAWRGFGPLLVINDDRIAAGGGFGMHPHRDMEIITVMVEGVLRHRDSMGHSEALRAGEVQRMSAGTGIVHSEINGADQPCRLLQIWIAPSSAGIAPCYEQKAYPPATGWTPLIDPDGAGGAMAIHRPVRLWRGRAGEDAASSQTSTGPGARALPCASLPLCQAAEAHGWIQVISGRLSLRLDPAAEREGPLAAVLEAGDGLGFAPGSSGMLEPLGPDADVLLFELR